MACSCPSDTLRKFTALRGTFTNFCHPTVWFPETFVQPVSVVSAFQFHGSPQRTRSTFTNPSSIPA